MELSTVVAAGETIGGAKRKARSVPPRQVQQNPGHKHAHRFSSERNYTRMSGTFTTWNCGQDLVTADGDLSRGSANAVMRADVALGSRHERCFNRRAKTIGAPRVAPAAADTFQTEVEQTSGPAIPNEDGSLSYLRTGRDRLTRTPAQPKLPGKAFIQTRQEV